MHGSQFGIGTFGLQFGLLDSFGEPGNIIAKPLYVTIELPKLLQCLACIVLDRFDCLKLGVCLNLTLTVIPVGQGWQRNAAFHVKGLLQLPLEVLPVFSALVAGEGNLRNHGVIGAHIGQHIIKTCRAVFCKPIFFLQTQDFDRIEPLVFSEKGQQLAGQGAVMGGIDVETGCAHQQVFRIGGFQDEQASRHEHTKGLGKQRLEQVERQMLGNMKTCHSQHAGTVQRTKMRQGINPQHIQTALDAGREHAVIRVHARGTNGMVIQQLQPFTAAAANVQNGHIRVKRGKRQKKRKINLKPLLDQFAGATVPVFKSAVKVGGN